MKKVITIFIILLLIGAGVFSYFKFIKKEDKDAEDKSKGLAAPVPVETVMSKKGDLPLYISSSGTLEANKINNYKAEVSGNVSIKVEEGDYVNKGDLLFTIDNTDYKVAYEKALISYKKAYVRYLSINKDIDTNDVDIKIDTENLYSEDKDIEKIQKETIEEIKSNNISEKRIKYRLGEKELALKQALSNYRKCKIRAPFSGVIGNINVSEGEYLDINQSILTLADISTLKIKAKIIAKDLNKLKEGKSAVLFPIVNDKEYMGKISAVNPIISESNSTYAVVKIKNNNHELKPGMFCDVKLQYDLVKNKVLVPKEALLEREEKTLVFVIRERNDKKLAYWNYVDVNNQNYEYIAIEDKLKPKKEVITKGHYTLGHKSAVIIKNKK